MKRRRGRRSLVWWSWLLALVSIGGLVGGYKYGEMQWENAPKDYLAGVQVTVRIRAPFVPKKIGTQLATDTMTNANEQEVLRRIESEEVVGKVVSNLELGGRWSMGFTEAVNKIKAGLQLDLDKETDRLLIQVTLNDSQEAAEVANALGGLVSETVKEVDERKKEAAFKLLETEARPLIDLESDAKTKLAKVLKENRINIEVSPNMQLGEYQFIKEVVTARVEWDSARADLQELAAEQREYRGYWERAVRPSLIAVRAEVPPTFNGPPKEPYQIRWLTYGLTAGMMLGSLLMLLCWKLFP